MSAWEVAVLGVLFIATLAGSAFLTLNILLPLGTPAAGSGAPICQRLPDSAP